MTATDELIETTWVYMGRRWDLTDRKLYFVFLDHDGQERSYSKGPLSPVVGARYTLKATADCSKATVSSAAYAGPSDDDRVDEWRLADRTAMNAKEAEAAVKRAAKDNADFGGLTLAEVRAMLVHQLPHQRAGMLTAVTQYLRGA